MILFPVLLYEAAEEKQKKKLLDESEKSVFELLGSYALADTVMKTKGADKKLSYVKELHISGKFQKKAALHLYFDKGMNIESRKKLLDTYVTPDSSSSQFFIVLPLSYKSETVVANCEKIFAGGEYEDSKTKVINRLTIELVRRSR